VGACCPAWVLTAWSRGRRFARGAVGGQIQVVPATEDEFVQFEGTSESAAAMQGFDFSTVKVGRAGFFVDGTVTSTDLPTCDPEQPFPAGGPPVCEGDH
jgi:hypothetical protein